MWRRSSRSSTPSASGPPRRPGASRRRRQAREPALPDERLRRLLGGDDLAQLRRRLRRHFERASTDAPQRTVRLGSLSEREYAALASLLGRPVRQASSIAVDVAAIDAALARAGIAPSLKAALELLDGPIVHVPTARAEALARWASVVADARHPDLARLLHTARGLGLLKRLARQDPHAARHLRERVDLVLKRLPASGVPRRRQTHGNAGPFRSAAGRAAKSRGAGGGRSGSSTGPSGGARPERVGARRYPGQRAGPSGTVP